MMNWLDLALAVPTVGILCRSTYRTVHDFAHDLLPMFEQRMGAENFRYSTKAPTAMEIDTSEGFEYKVTQENVVVQFRYSQAVIDPPAGFPRLETKGELQPYTKLLDRSLAETRTFLNLLLRHGDTRQVRRIGVVASASLDAPRAPPGVERLLQHLGRPWGADMTTGFQVKLTARLSDTKGGAYDRCHHHLVLDKDERPDSLSVVLDWQRVYEPSQTWSVSKILENLESCVRNALDYFERFGSGDLNYG